MTSSSTASRQLELELEIPRQEASSFSSGEPAPRSDRSSGTLAAAGLSPQRDATKQVFADTTRMAGRLNAASVSDDELKGLLAERQVLLDRKLDGSMTRQEELRLQYVRWTLDRIEDARTGHDLAAFEEVINAYEQFGDHVNRLTSELTHHAGTAKKKKRK